jgi:hypothetical protein
MNEPKKWAKITGLVLHLLIAALLLVAGSGGIYMWASGKVPEEAGPIGQLMWLIGAGQIVTALLLAIPRTASLGVLLTSGFWGGTICLHMSKGEAYWMQSTLLLVTWIAAYLRIPAMFSSFWGSSTGLAQTAEHSEPAVR